jgi:hypothetical protein
MRHGNIAVRIIEEFLRVRAKSMPVVIYASDRAPGCSMVCPVATLSASCGNHDIPLLAILRRLVSAPLSADT